jgi:predicted permease
MAPLLQDLRYALRTLRKSPLFTFVAVVSLALGIGANTAIFTLVNQLMLQLLPVQHPEELVLLNWQGAHYGSNTGMNSLSYPMYREIRDKNQVFSAMFAKFDMSLSLNVDGRTQLVLGELVSGNFFPVLGVRAALGRLFTASDDLYQGSHPQAVLSYGYWNTRFAADPGVLGRRIQVNGYPFTIIGVSQAGFDGVEVGASPQIRVPMMMKHQLTQFYSLNSRRGKFAQVFGRLKPGESLVQAHAGLQPLFHQILEYDVKLPDFAKATDYNKQQFLRASLDVLPASRGRSDLRQKFSDPLWALMGMVGLVLLIACSNVANLLIARANARQKEIAVRLAIGSGRGRLIGQLLTESLLLSLAGGLAGLCLSVLIDRALLTFLPARIGPLTLSATPDARVLEFTAALSLLTGLLFGLVPALQATRPDLAGTLKDQAGAVLGGVSVLLRKSLVVAQVSFSLLLLIGCGLFLQSLRNLRDLNPGFQTQSLLAFAVNPTINGYKPERSFQFYRDLMQRVSGLPGVVHAAFAVVPVLDNNEWDSSIAVEGYTAKESEDVDPHMQYISPGFFDTMGIPVLVGRDFSLRDEQAAPKAGIVNEKFARKYFAGRSPIGLHVGMGGDPGTKLDIEVVGVVRDTRYEDLRREVPYELYIPYVQAGFVQGMTCYVRGHGDAANLTTSLRQAVNTVDSSVPVYRVRTLEQQVDQSLMTERLLASLSTVFGCLATLLAALGLYGVMAYMVARRTREIGIRMALGAASGRVVWLVMREALLLAAIGIALGAPAAWALSRLIRTELFGILPADLATTALGIAGIAAVAALSAYLPARRATRIDPMRALRWE